MLVEWVSDFQYFSLYAIDGIASHSLLKLVFIDDVTRYNPLGCSSELVKTMIWT